MGRPSTSDELGREKRYLYGIDEKRRRSGKKKKRNNGQSSVWRDDEFFSEVKIDPPVWIENWFLFPPCMR
jgi:hypothetical protein